MTTENETQDTSTSLVVVEKSTALDVFKDTTQITALIQRVRDLATAEQHDATTPAGRAAIKTLAVKVQRSKTYIDGIGKELVDDLKELPKRIDAARKLAREELDKLRDEVRKPLTDWEAEQARIKAEKEAAERAEQERVAAVQRAITGYTQAPLDAIGQKYAMIASIIETLEADPPTAEFFGDRFEEAQAAWTLALDKLRHMAEQAESIEKQEQVERERQIAERAAAAEREANERKIMEARIAEQRAEQERQAAEQRAAAAEAAAAQAAEQAAAREELARQQAAERERQRIAAEQEAARQAEAARAANTEHRKRINNDAVNCLVTHSGLNIEQARKVIIAVAQQQISNVTINY